MRSVLTDCKVALEGLAEGTASVMIASRCLIKLLFISFRGSLTILPVVLSATANPDALQ